MGKNLPYDRTERVSDEVYRIVAEALRTKLTDPRLAGTCITRVNMTRDLRVARICFHFEDPSKKDRKTALDGFKSASGFLKRCIGETIELKFMPEIKFYYDEGVDTGDRIEELLRSVKRHS